MTRYPLRFAASVSASWASRSAWSRSFCARATRARVTSAIIRCAPRATETASSAQRRARVRFATCQRNLGKRGDVDDRQLGLDAHQLPSLLGGAGRRLHVTRGQGRGGQRRAGKALGELAEVRGAMHSRGRGGPCSCRVAAVDEQVAQADETRQPPALVVRGFGLGNEVAELRDGAGDVALPPLRQSQTPAAHAQVVAITDRLGNIASFFAGRARLSRITLSR